MENINYRENKNIDISRHIDILTELPIITFGEGNFTFVTALASIRGSWDNILGTTLHDIPDFRQTLQTVETNRRFKPTEEVGFPSSYNYLGGIDATNFDLYELKAKLICANKLYHSRFRFRLALWFQCPWGYNESTADLIKSFIKEAGTQEFAGFICIGIVNFFPHVTKYELDGILNVSDNELTGMDSFAELHGFRFVEASREYSQRLIDHGYRHEGKIDIHDKIKKNHLTLVFEKK